MQLPNFIGIGVPKAGTTWLYELLQSHPQVFLPSRRKEIYYFNKFHDRPLNWYAYFFDEADLSKHLAVGEITPHYFFGEETPERISKVDSIDKLILMVRNPINRLHSHYWHTVRFFNYEGTFAEYVNIYPDRLEQGLYFEHLTRFLSYFDSSQILVLFYEEVTARPEKAFDELSAFLGIDKLGFPSDAGQKVINQRFLPKYRRAYALATGVAQFLQKNDLDFLIKVSKWFGGKKVFGQDRNQSHAVDERTLAYLCDYYESDVVRFLELTARDPAIWGWRNGGKMDGQG